MEVLAIRLIRNALSIIGYEKYASNERRKIMNEDIMKGKWKEIKGEVKKQWGKLTDDDLTEAEGNEEKMVGLLQKKYGYAKDKAEEEYRGFMNRHQSPPPR